VEDEGRLKNLLLRERFLSRVFAFARLRSLQHSSSRHALVSFHAANKLLLMAYSQTNLRKLGRIVANSDHQSIATVLDLYGNYFRKAFIKTPRHTAPINVLTHTLGYFKKELSAREKRHFLQMLEAYRHGRTPLSAAVAILRSWIVRFQSEDLRHQTFFNPFPEDLMALDDSGRPGA
jgi:uncharacterized protein YbgA (DUF1722 family)